MLDAINANHPFDCMMITNHVWWPAGNDTFYVANIPENTARVNYYGVNAVPQVYLDGCIDGSSSGPWEQMMLDRCEIESPLVITVTGAMLTSTTGRITADITNTTGADVSGKLHFVLVEDNCTFQGKTYQHVMRDYFPVDASGEQVTIPAWGNYIQMADFTLRSFYHRQNMEAIVYVQNDATREVYQAGRIFFDLDQPELVVAANLIDDSAGDADGRFDPGETAAITFQLGNLNPTTATGVTATLSSTDPKVTIVDGSCSWPDIASGDRQWNTGDPASFTVAANTPWGYVASLTLTVTAAGGYSSAIPVKIPVGDPDNPIGPDAYGYMAYENGDPYAPSPLYVWTEIDPNLGGGGTLINLADDQTVNFAMPFTLKYYGNTFTRLSVCSNGLIAPGIVSGTFAGNGDIPGTTGPVNMIAGFWTDLYPPGGGKVYQYYDAPNHRFIVEFSHVRHYGSEVEETFEFILRDPVYNPTPSGDGPIDIMYKEVQDPSGCAVGIQDGTRTIGIQYWNNGVPNAACQGLVSGRAVTFTTMPLVGASAPEGRVGIASARLWAGPNPASGKVRIRYDLPAAGAVSLRVFNVEGAVVRTLLNGQRPAGAGTVEWDGKNDGGRGVPAGAYFYRLAGPGFEVDRKVIRR